MTLTQGLLAQARYALGYSIAAPTALQKQTKKDRTLTHHGIKPLRFGPDHKSAGFHQGYKSRSNLAKRWQAQVWVSWILIKSGRNLARGAKIQVKFSPDGIKGVQKSDQLFDRLSQVQERFDQVFGGSG